MARLAPPAWTAALATRGGPAIRASVCLALASALVAGCVAGGDDPPGCRTDHPEDCDEGWSCRAGVCVHPTTPLSSPDASVEASTPDASVEAGAAD